MICSFANARSMCGDVKSKRGREEGDLSPVPFPEGKGCLLVGMSPRGLASALGGDGLLPLL